MPWLVNCEVCGAESFNLTRTRIRRFCSIGCRNKVIKPHQRPLADRFWAKVDKSGDCWLWTGAVDPRGYGAFRWMDRTNVKAHRAAWMFTNGDIPSGLFVCHRCDNPSCVRPDHLFLGTNADNVADMDTKGRRQNRTDHRKTKLIESDVIAIRIAAAQGVGPVELGRRYGVHPPTITNIVRRRAWKHVA